MWLKVLEVWLKLPKVLEEWLEVLELLRAGGNELGIRTTVQTVCIYNSSVVRTDSLSNFHDAFSQLNRKYKNDKADSIAG